MSCALLDALLVGTAAAAPLSVCLQVELSYLAQEATRIDRQAPETWYGLVLLVATSVMHAKLMLCVTCVSFKADRGQLLLTSTGAGHRNQVFSAGE